MREVWKAFLVVPPLPALVFATWGLHRPQNRALAFGALILSWAEAAFLGLLVWTVMLR